jgi:Ni,Fe-hydrogenase I cytochrome b subunit
MKQNETSTSAGQSPFIQTHSAAIHIWHWVTFLTLTFIVIIADLGKTKGIVSGMINGGK